MLFKMTLEKILMLIILLKHIRDMNKFFNWNDVVEHIQLQLEVDKSNILKIKIFL